jgi:heme exporter protein D
MYFDSLQALLFMEGHGAYVWFVYLVTVLVIAAVLIAPVRRRKRLLARLNAELGQSQTSSRRSKV